MGIFDFFKTKKKINQEEQSVLAENRSALSVNSQPKKSINEMYADRLNASTLSLSTGIFQPASEEQFQLIYKYREYVVLFTSMMFRDNQSPIAAFEDTQNNLVGYLYVTRDMSFNYTVPEVLEMMETEFERRMSAGTILSYAMFYHSEYNNDGNHAIAHEDSKYTAITMKYNSVNGPKGSIGFPYSIENNAVTYRGFSFFSDEQNASILSTELDEAKNYFQERVEIKPEISENEFGLTIKKVNNGSLGHMWSGIFGFDRLNKSQQNVVIEYAALAMIQLPETSTDELIISGLKYNEVIFRAIQKKDQSRTTFFPVVTNPEFINVKNQFIAEWINAGGLEAVISGGSSDTFAMTYFATDYAEKKAIYHSHSNLNISLSGIILYLSEVTEEEMHSDSAPDFSKDFTMYMPHKDLGELGVYDFIGILEEIHDMNLLEDGNISGHILKIRLINDVVANGRFSIPMFLNNDNTEIRNFQIGMKLGGLFQMQGEIKL